MGDKQNTIKKLQAACKAVKFADKLDFEQISNGSPRELMKLYQYLFGEFSPVISAEVTGKYQVDLSGKEDKPFMECLYRLMRDMFDYVPKLTRDQFFTTSYAQVKATMAIEIIELVQKKLKTPPSAGSSGSNSTSSERANPILSSTQNGPISQPERSTSTMTSKVSKTNLKTESSENGVSKQNGHHLPPKASRPAANGSVELGSKIEAFLSRLEQVEKYCQEITREKVQSKESRTFKDEDISNGIEIVHGDGEIDLQAIKTQSDESTKQEEIVKSYESEVSREEFEKIASRVTNIERILVNIELKQNTVSKQLAELLSKQAEIQSPSLSH